MDGTSYIPWGNDKNTSLVRKLQIKRRLGERNVDLKWLKWKLSCEKVW